MRKVNFHEKLMPSSKISCMTTKNSMKLRWNVDKASMAAISDAMWKWALPALLTESTTSSRARISSLRGLKTNPQRRRRSCRQWWRPRRSRGRGRRRDSSSQWTTGCCRTTRNHLGVICKFFQGRGQGPARYLLIRYKILCVSHSVCLSVCLSTNFCVSITPRVVEMDPTYGVSLDHKFHGECHSRVIHFAKSVRFSTGTRSYRSVVP